MNHLDGKKIAAWLEAEIPEILSPDHRDDLLSRRLSSWRAGETASVWAVDTILTRYGHHIYEIPQSYYCQRNYHPPTYPEYVRELAIKLYKDGMSPRTIGLKLHISTHTVYKWRKAAGIPSQHPAKSKAA